MEIAEAIFTPLFNREGGQIPGFSSLSLYMATHFIETAFVKIGEYCTNNDQYFT